MLAENGLVFHTENVGVARAQLRIVLEVQGPGYRVVKILPDGTLGELDE
jgi:hypothetical protein